MCKTDLPDQEKYRVRTQKPNPLLYVGAILFAVLWLMFGLLLTFKLVIDQAIALLSVGKAININTNRMAAKRATTITMDIGFARLWAHRH
jgi:hypothetical protein